MYNDIMASLNELMDAAQGKKTGIVRHNWTVNDITSHFDDLQEVLTLEKGKGAKYTHLEIVDEYLRSHNPSSMKAEQPFNLRGYLSYVDANHITDPKEISDDVIESFFHHEE